MKNKATQTGAIFGLAMIAIIAAVTTIAAAPEANADGVRRGKAATIFAVKQCPADQR